MALKQLLLVFEEDGAVAVGGAPQPVFETKRPTWFPEGIPVGVRLSLHRPTGAADARPCTDRASMSVCADAIRELNGFLLG